MNLRRGFKTEANTYSREMREELGLALTSPLCPFQTAEHLEVEVRRLSLYLNWVPEEAALLMREAGDVDFSATTGCYGSRRIIIYNDARALTRSRADIMHEIAHMLLHHPPHRVCAAGGGRHYNRVMEDEAGWLGPAMLVSEEAALWIVQQGISPNEAARLYGVSEQLMRMRLNVTAAYRRAARAA